MAINLQKSGRGRQLIGPRGDKKERPENVIPMINVVFLLLLYFMVAGNLHIDLDVNPPASSATNEPLPGIPELSVKSDGTISLQGNPIEQKDISGKLAELFKNHVVQISADAKTDAVVVANLIDAVGAAGAKHINLLSLQR